MKTIAVMNLKGGVGKTTTAIQFASILASEHRKRVLLIDADSQCNLTSFFLENPQGSLAALLEADSCYAGLFARSLVQRTEHDGVLDIMPADDTLMNLDLSCLQNGRVNAQALAEALTDFASVDLYDYCIIDCPPAFNAAAAAALLAAEEVLIPIKLDAFSLRGMANLLRQVEGMKRLNPMLCVAGCLVTMCYQGKVFTEALAQLHASGLPVFAQRIRRSDKVDAMTFAQSPLRIFSPNCAAGVDYRRFVREYLYEEVYHDGEIEGF